MKFKFVAPALVTTLALAATAPFAAEVKAEGDISFSCERHRGSPATFIVEGGTKQESPMIVWQTRYFGSGWNPSQRCRAVTDRLNNLLSSPGIDNVLFTNGRVNGQNAICWIADENEKCSSSNVLFTLKKGVEPVAVLEQLEAKLLGQAEVPSLVNAGGERKVVRLNSLVRK